MHFHCLDWKFHFLLREIYTSRNFHPLQQCKVKPCFRYISLAMVKQCKSFVLTTTFIVIIIIRNDDEQATE